MSTHRLKIKVKVLRLNGYKNTSFRHIVGFSITKRREVSQVNKDRVKGLGYYNSMLACIKCETWKIHY